MTVSDSMGRSFEPVDDPEDIIYQPASAQRAFADAVEEFSANCATFPCKGMEDGGQEACAICLVTELSPD